MHIAVRHMFVPLTVGAVAFTGLTVPAQAASHPSAVRAARWQATQLDAKGGIFNDQFNFTDWGLTADTVIALKATGVKPQIAKKSTAYIAAHVRSYNSLDDSGQPGVRFSGPTGKLLYLATATKSNPRNFGGFDLRAESLALMTKSGVNKGRFQDKGTTDYSNSFGQSLNILGLARSGGVPSDAVKFLIKQQCAAGGFRLFPDTAAPTCDQATNPILDPDTTGIAVQSLLTAYKSGNKAAGPAARKGALWLLGQQAADGSFKGSGPTASPNTNSTGLAGQALRAVGQSGLVSKTKARALNAGAAKAGRWVRTLQLTPGNAGKASGDVGAIAYNKAAFTEAQQNGITPAKRDQWRRANPQALLVLAGVALGDIGK
ncbi:hypothetical protein [Actinomadura terrae]|uniref:hypothetical protein n=1 Tax=Actinomadura terrae TaxID=604353 RepID=UPI001FA6FF09|nr:hypothetical protein [Actinomadura terrae]